MLICSLRVFEKVAAPQARHKTPFSCRAEMHAKGACNHFAGPGARVWALRFNACSGWVATSQPVINAKSLSPSPYSLATMLAASSASRYLETGVECSDVFFSHTAIF
jgi:hypothetical protein